MCSLHSEGGAQAAADEDEHPDEAEDPRHEDHVEVVCHGPIEGITCVKHRSCANRVVLGEKAGADGDQDSKLEEASEHSAVDGADSPSVSPRSNKHKERVEADDAVGCTHQGGHHCELGALCLAVDVTIFIKLN